MEFESLWLLVKTKDREKELQMKKENEYSETKREVKMEMATREDLELRREEENEI